MQAKIHPAFPEPEGLWPTAAPPERDERRTDAERVAAIREGAWIDNPVAREAGARIAEFVGRPWAPYQRWRGALFVGGARSGRSALLERSVGGRSRYDSQRTVVARWPSSSSEGSFWNAVMEGVLERSERSAPTRELRSRALAELPRRGAIAFDGADALGNAGNRLWPALARIKGMGEDARVPVVLVVPPKVAARVAANDDWRDRFEPMRLRPWRIDRDWLALLSDWEAALPLLETSHLADRDLAMHLYALSDGRIGRLATILREAALSAIGSATERITIGQLDALGFSPPPRASPASGSDLARLETTR